MDITHRFNIRDFVYCNELHIASQTELSTGLSLQPVTHPQQLLEVSDGLNNTAQCLRREDGLDIKGATGQC